METWGKYVCIWTKKERLVVTQRCKMHTERRGKTRILIIHHQKKKNLKIFLSTTFLRCHCVTTRRASSINRLWKFQNIERELSAKNFLTKFVIFSSLFHYNKLPLEKTRFFSSFSGMGLTESVSVQNALALSSSTTFHRKKYVIHFASHLNFFPPLIFFFFFLLNNNKKTTVLGLKERLYVCVKVILLFFAFIFLALCFCGNWRRVN